VHEIWCTSRQIKGIEIIKMVARIKKDGDRKLSYSQYGLWKQCKRRYKLKYIDKIPVINVGTIHTIFGTAVHETIQKYLTVLYTQTKREADLLDLNQILLDNMRSEFSKAKSKLADVGVTDQTLICSKEQMSEAYGNGVQIIKWFKNPKNQSKFYKKRGYSLVGIEMPLELYIRDGIYVVGFIDVIIKNESTGRILIIDLKTSKRGWSSYDKAKDEKKNQILLYKKWYSEQYGFPIEKIDVQFQIMRKEVNKNAEFPIPRMSRFSPSDGTVSINRAIRDFDDFVDSVFNSDGTVKLDSEADFPKNPTKLCDYCEFFGAYCDGK